MSIGAFIIALSILIFMANWMYSKRKGEKATLIKLFKKKQEMKADLPTIGIKTLQLCNKSFMGGIVFSANKTLFIDNKKIIENMKKNRMFLLGIDV